MNMMNLKLQEPNFALPFDTIIHGQYLIGRVLGIGGFGITYQGYDLGNGRFVAIKEFYPNGMVSRVPGTASVNLSKDIRIYQKGKDKFLQEARIIHNCPSRYVLKIYSLFEENNTAYYVMEFLEGRDLMQYLGQKGGKIKWPELKVIVDQIIEALEYVHREGIIHRDISPDNIYLCSDNNARLIDFGTARKIIEGKSLSVIIKKGYAPPEQYMTRGKQGPWTDVYALGSTIYRALTGKLPPDALSRVRGDELVPIQKLAPDVPGYIDSAIAKAMNLDEDARYRSVEKFREALQNPGHRFRDRISLPKKKFTENISSYLHSWASMNPTLTGVSGIYAGQSFSVDQDIIMGRDPACCNVIFPTGAAGISKVHCQICLNINGYRAIIDCGSSFGTFLNGVELYPGSPAILQSGSEIRLGSKEIFRFDL